MTHRFVGVAGKQFSGDRARAQELTGLARILVQQCVNEIGHRGGLGQAYRIKKLPDGSTIHVTVIQNLKGIAPIVRTQLFAPQPYTHKPLVPAPHYWLATVWVPEGFVITPRNAEAPQGWGFPKRHHLTGEKINPPFGTAKTIAHQRGCVQVMINKFENNKYLDHPDFIVGLERDGKKAPFKLIPNPALRDPVVKDNFPVAVYPPEHPACFYPPYITWPQYYEPIDQDPDFWDNWHQKPYKNINIPGVNVWLPAVDGNHTFEYYPAELDDDGKPLWRQFDENGNDLIYEPESSQWFAHWPEELLYPSDAHEAIFQASNELRQAAAGEQRIYRSIRGHAHPAFMVAQENAIAKLMAHNSNTFRDGHTSTLARVAASGEMSAGENVLAAFSHKAASIQTGLLFTKSWEESPGHYANIVYDLWSYGCHLDIGYLPYGGIDERKATHASQLFLDPAPVVQGGWQDQIPEAAADIYADLFESTKPAAAAFSAVYNPTALGAVGWETWTHPFYPDVNPWHRFEDVVANMRTWGLRVTFRGKIFTLGVHAIEPRKEYVSIIGATAFTENNEIWIRVVLTRSDDNIAFTEPNSKYHYKSQRDIVVAKFRAPGVHKANYPAYADVYYGVELTVESIYSFARVDPTVFFAGPYWPLYFTAVSFTQDGALGRFSMLSRLTNGNATLDGPFAFQPDSVFYGIARERSPAFVSCSPTFAVSARYDFAIENGVIRELDIVDYSLCGDEPVEILHHYRDDELHHWNYILPREDIRNGKLIAPSGKVYDLGTLYSTFSWIVALDIYNELAIFAKGAFAAANGFYTQLQSISFYFEDNQITPSYTVTPVNEGLDRGDAYVHTVPPVFWSYPEYSAETNDDVPNGAFGQIACYKNEYIWALKVYKKHREHFHTSDGFDLPRVTSSPKGACFWGSSLNLEQLTGMSNIEDIYPIGVI